jgi:hypothetical protein
VTKPLDLLLPAALERWWKASRSLLAARGVTATLQGRFDAPGMDPVYILHMDSEHRETVVCLFQGGTVLFDGFDKQHAAKVDGGSAEVGSEHDLVGLLARLAERV